MFYVASTKLYKPRTATYELFIEGVPITLMPLMFTLNEFSKIAQYIHRDTLEKRNEITFNFYTGLPHMDKEGVG